MYIPPRPRRCTRLLPDLCLVYTLLQYDTSYVSRSLLQPQQRRLHERGTT